MSTNLDNEYASDNLISQAVKAKPRIKKSSEQQQDNDSLNTMDYYRDDSSNKNSLIDELKSSNKLLFDPNKIEQTPESEIQSKKKDSIPLQKNMNTNKDDNMDINIHSKRKNSTNNPKTQKTLNEMHKICSKCYTDVGNSNLICIKCKNIFCKKCFKGNYGKNLYNNKDNNDNNKEQDLTEKNEKICQYCRNNSINNKNKNEIKKKILEPLDSMPENEISVLTERNNDKSRVNTRNKSEGKIKSLKDKLNEYEEFLNKINDCRIEVEFKKNICMNILQMIKKAIEIEYDKYLNKLNELSTKINKIKEDINQKINNSNKVFKNEVEIQINIDTYKNTLNGFSKIFDNYSQKIISRPIFRGYKLYESSNILINQSEIYYMKNKEILSDLPFGNVYLKIDKFTNNFINYINFTAIIKPKNKSNSTDTNNNNAQNEINKKSRFIVNMIVNNKMIRLNKTNKDNNDTNLNYECSEEENRILLIKEKNNLNISKTKKFNVKVIISEIIL